MLRKTLCSIGLVFLALLPAAAQEVPKAEVFGGYSWAGGNFHGWNASVTGNITKRLGIVADFSGHYGSEQDGTILVRENAHSFLFGPRVSFRGKRLSPLSMHYSGQHDFRNARPSPVKDYLDLTP